MHSLSQKTLAAALALSVGALPTSVAAQDDSSYRSTASPIKHVVVIFQENVSFDHYFATYPIAKNTDGTSFYAKPSTPTVNGLMTAGLLFHNPNSTQPFRLGTAMNYTCDQDHDYGDEQKAFDEGLMDMFPETVGVGAPGCPDYGHGKALVMGYFDGNTVTALWNYAQYFAMSDNSFGTTFGPSTPGAINLVSGQTHGVNAGNDSSPSDVIAGSVIGDPDPVYDDCSGSAVIGMSGRNVGDLLNAKGVTWGWFQGGFRPTSTVAGKAVCGAKTLNLGGSLQTDYSPHHEPFQYYKSTSNPHHLPPTSVSAIGRTDQANHQYDLTDFWAAVDAHNMPAVSFVKAKRSQDGHAGYSSPLDEQLFIADTLNRLQRTPEWRDTAVIISYDDSDGWYDHVMSPILNSSATSEDQLNGPGKCGNRSDRSLGGYQGRCGYGPRLPLLVVSPFARRNFVDNTTTDQSSILRFIEDNWNLGRIGDGSFDAIAGPLNGMFDFRSEGNAPRVFVDPVSGRVTSVVGGDDDHGDRE